MLASLRPTLTRSVMSWRTATAVGASESATDRPEQLGQRTSRARRSTRWLTVSEPDRLTEPMTRATASTTAITVHESQRRPTSGPLRPGTRQHLVEIGGLDRPEEPGHDQT